MAFNVILYPDKIAKLTNAKIQALKLTTEQLRGEIIEAQVIPFDEGTLQNIATEPDWTSLEQGEAKIVHNTPYARRLYYHPEYNFQKLKNPNAQGLWWEPWLIGDKKDRAKELFKKFYKLVTGGIVK